MYNANLPSPPAPPSKKTWPPILGILSVITVIFPFLFICALCILVYAVGSSVDFQTERMGQQEVANLGLGMIALICASVVASIVGIVVGIGALFGRTSNKILGIIGVVLNFILLIGVCGGFTLLYVIGAGS
jgi:hypothetical protein